MGNAGIDEDEGIIPRAIKDIFHSLHNSRKGQQVASVRVSMIEIYNDDCKDLLHPDIAPRDIMIREDLDGRIFFTGAREEVAQDIQTAMYYLERGNLNRSTAETLMNTTSSRSHAIFTISIEILEYPGVQQHILHHTQEHKTDGVVDDDNACGDGHVSTTADVADDAVGGSCIQAKLHLVDLAGSERAKRTGALGVRLKESVGINQVSNHQYHHYIYDV